MKRNRYDRKQQHKRELKKKHAIQWDNFDVNIDEIIAREEYERDLESGISLKWNDERNGGYNYWDNYYISGARKYAKDCTNRKIRSKYRNLLANQEFEHIMTLSGSQYEKEFDYFWTIW